MAAFKTLNSQDIIVSPLEVNKGFSFEGSTELTSTNVSIDRYLGINTDPLSDHETTGEVSQYTQGSIYNSIKQLYYSNYLQSNNGETSNVALPIFNPDGTITGEAYSPLYYNYLSSDLNVKRYFPQIPSPSLWKNTHSLWGNTHILWDISLTPNDIGVMSIPKNLFGDYIQPNSLEITTESGSYFDDGEGALKRVVGNRSVNVGNVIYEHGIIILTGGSRQDGLGSDGYGVDEYGIDIYGGRRFDSNDILNFVNSSNITCSFSSSYLLYETQYKCTIGESEFNYSQNPSITLGEDGTPLSFINEDYFSPYVTTIGLYNDRSELLAVGKLAQPLPTSQTTDTTVLVNLDRQ